VILSDWPHGLAYVIVFAAAAVEGEVTFVTASVLVHLGRLNPVGVLVAGALGGSAGDQFFFYALRGRLQSWLSRFPSLHRRQTAVAARVGRHAVLMVLACRFLPGLRIAISAACAYAGVPARTYSPLSLISGFAWASTIMAIVAWGGPKWMAWVGLPGWWGALIPAGLIILFFRWLARASSRMKSPSAEEAAR
jgi:membrane protein DedA with SNARE-associated domain